MAIGRFDLTGLPVSITVTRGQTHESTRVEPLLEEVSVGGKQRPRRKTVRLIAGDKGYDGAPARTARTRRRQKTSTRSYTATPSSSSDATDTSNSPVASRRDKLAVNCAGMIQLALVLAFINIILSDTA
jgi:transposase